MHRAGFANIYTHAIFQQCIVNIDRNAFEDVTFRNSVVRYRGGPVVLNRVAFENCRFVLDLPEDHRPAPAERGLLTALLQSPDQKNVQIIEIALSARTSKLRRLK